MRCFKIQYFEVNDFAYSFSPKTKLSINNPNAAKGAAAVVITITNAMALRLPLLIRNLFLVMITT